MSPTPAPDATSFKITGDRAVIQPSGTGKDWDNWKTLFDDPTIRAIKARAGRYYMRYQSVWKPTLEDSKIQGANNRSVFVAGLPNTRMDLLDNVDREVFEFNGLPSLLHVLPAVGANPEVKAKLEGMAFEGSEGPGYTGVGFGGLTLLNHGLFSLLRVGGHHPMSTLINVPVTMTGVAAQSMPAGDGNLNSVVVRKLSDNPAGQVTYAEGTDYTLDAATGTIARLAGGIITDGQVVRVKYNAADSTANNRRDVAHVNVKVINCNRSGRFERIAGVDHSNTEFGVCCISRTRLLRTSPFGVRSYAVITEAGLVTPDAGGLKYADMTWDISFRPIHPVNLEMKIEDSEDSRMALAYADFGVDGQPDAGDTSNYIFGSKTVKEASIQYKNNKMIETNVDNVSGSVPSVTSGFGSGRRIRFNKNEAINSGSIASARIGRADNIARLLRLSGWLGELDDVEINENEAVGARKFGDTLGGFANEQIKIRNTAGRTVEKARNLKISGNTIKLSRTEVPINFQGRPNTIQVERVDGCGVEANVLESKAPARTGIRLQQTDNCRVDANSFKKYAKAAGQVDILVTSGSTANTLVVDEQDLIQDDGTDTVIDDG